MTSKHFLGSNELNLAPAHKESVLLLDRLVMEENFISLFVHPPKCMASASRCRDEAAASDHGTVTHSWRVARIWVSPTSGNDLRYAFAVRVEFFKVESHGRQHSAWEATRGKRTRTPGTAMAGGRGIPHDLAQYVIEAASGYRNGFWDLVPRGRRSKAPGDAGPSRVEP
jgi:hypothetical protein